MDMPSKVLLLTLLLAFLFTAEGAYQYITPDSSGSGCPSWPCLTLEQYIRESDKFFTTGSMFEFLPGNHSLQTPLNITDVSDVSFHGIASRVTVIAKAEVTVINCTRVHVSGLTFILYFNQKNKTSQSVFSFYDSREVVIANSTFLNVKMNTSARAVYCNHSSIDILNCKFEAITEFNGGAIDVQCDTNITLVGNAFIGNKARKKGGAIYGSKSTISLSTNDFSYNSGEISGGALFGYSCTVRLMGRHTFHGNFLTGIASKTTGGAIAMNGGSYAGSINTTGYVSYSNNKAGTGGAIYAENTQVLFRDFEVTFGENVADVKGGGMHLIRSSLKTEKGRISFVGNVARGVITPGRDGAACGVICHSKGTSPGHSIDSHNSISATLMNNSGTQGSALYFEGKTRLVLNSIRASGNSDCVVGVISAEALFVGTSVLLRNACHQKGGGVVTVIHSKVDFSGTVNISRSIGGAGLYSLQSNIVFRDNTVIYDNVEGGINSIESSLQFAGNTLFCNNHGFQGGAIHTEKGDIGFSMNTTFLNNTAKTKGGALYLYGTNVSIGGAITFTSNSAQYGGAIYLLFGASLTFEWHTRFTTDSNMATEYGGAIYHKDSVTAFQCRSITVDVSFFQELPSSFLQVNNLTNCPNMTSYNDIAVKDGSFLYGGLLNRTRLLGVLNHLPYEYFTELCKITILSQNHQANSIASYPYHLCLCDGDVVTDCSGIHNVTVYPGQAFSFHILAIGQGKSIVPTMVSASISRTARLQLNQSLQAIPRNCSKVTFNLYSYEDYEHLILDPDSPCLTSSTVINVSFHKCPDAFMKFEEKCVCEERLKRYNTSCAITQNGPSILRPAGSTFWMNATHHANGSYKGLILYSSCPAEYCKAKDVTITLDDPDVQCVSNRSGILCGGCAHNYSLMLGSSKCGECSNIYILLIIPFALAGVALIMLLSFLKLTVATGNINSLILYANVVQVNKRAFFPTGILNPLTVFIAWMNLDFGIETCFFNGMSAYTQTWFQFAFSAYIWILIATIILISRYSITMSKLIGSNPTAVLATLVLMSYNKILKINFDVLSSVDLKYPNEREMTVWLKDGNVSYLHSKHLFLSIVTILFLIFIFLPYTIFLLLGHTLYRLPYHWVLIKIKPLLDSYYAPYKQKTRYWTGLLLLVRCSLYLVFSKNSLGRIGYSLMSIIIAFSIVWAIAWLNKGIYLHFYIDVIEVSIYLNLIVLSAATLTVGNNAVVTNVLVGIVFATLLGIVAYQVYVSYLVEATLWHKIVSKISQCRRNTSVDDPIPLRQAPEPVTETVVNLREPLLEN